jgi:hypothetical protein
MPKLPANYVKGPGFDNPLRATASVLKAEVERSLSLRLDEGTWSALQAACAAEGVGAEALVIEALKRHLALVEHKAIASPPEPAVSQRAVLIDQLYEQFVKRSWVQCVMTFRAILRERRV